MNSGSKSLKTRYVLALLMPMALWTMTTDAVWANYGGAQAPAAVVQAVSVMPQAVVGSTDLANLATANNSGVNPATVNNSTEPVQGAAAPATDPVYKAWEEFLKRRSEASAKAAVESAAQVMVSANPGSVPVAAPMAAPQPAPVTVAMDGVVAAPLTPTTLGIPELRQGGMMPGDGLGGLLATLVGGMGLAGAYALRRKAPKLGEWLRSRAGKDGERTRVKVVSVNPLSSQGSIAVVEVGGQLLVLGVTSGRVSLLTRLDQTGAPVPTATPARDEDALEVSSMTDAASLFRETPREATPPRSAVANDFSALLNNLAKESGESVTPVANSPLARYAAMNSLKKETSIEPPPEDMATQVLRKMKTMKRFRSAA